MSYTKVIIEDLVELGTFKDVEPRTLANREAVKADLLLFERPAFSGSEFKKTSYEKELLVRCKKRWREEMRAAVPNWTRKSDYYSQKITL